MTLTDTDTRTTGRLAPSTFGAGGAEPYAAALQSEANVLYLHSVHSERNGMAPMDAGRWSADADATDHSLLDGATGPVLDIGCGPGRMVRAAMDRGLSAVGVDVSPTAVRIALAAGLTVLNRSVFDQIPLEGTWGTLLLVDGNIGIGGDPEALLRRCAALLARHGELIIEVSGDPGHELSYEGTIEDSMGRRSSSFPWAEIGVDALRVRAAAVGLTVTQSWLLDGRSFARLARR
ncbi:class I SAM-dependent methyltransferase [Cryobacterium melibiosiphilum]|uniref:Class I SAM-dependent methyltransferase n=1 Tax=Cryobacterium melibiosiphilum TaxID=995039 RepID=A0A3A5MCH8_9MICO|nr:methyltransferase domain-containing protein [Cryobacterium melibiosiphilum]RJT87830.1 class I SAM-dependent methyltransferase [Cryobacterium melibiosiphilum]